MRKNPKLLKALYNLAMVMAVTAVNSACFFRYYQEKMDPQLDALKKHYEE